MAKMLWKPSTELINSSNIKKFIDEVNKKYNLTIQDYNDLYKWSITNIEQFWEEVWLFTDIKYSKKYSKIVEDLTEFPGTQWFPGAKLNFSENLLRYNDEKIALKFNGEAKDSYNGSFITYEDLRLEVSAVAQSLRALGISSGDRVVAYMPNIIETVISMLACASIGAVWASCGSELGASAVIDRLGQVEPKLLFTVDGYIYKGKEFNILQNVVKIKETINSLQKVVVFPFLDTSPSISTISDSELWEEFKSKNNENIQFEQLPFNHPLYIMFSSGTTGKPKCMVQSAGGILINHVKELMLQSDLKRSDTICYVTSPSWMMWNWLISSLAVGSTILLFNGNPSFPDWKTIWNIIEEEETTIFGTSASYIYYLMNENLVPKDHFSLSQLRQISQTASSLSSEGFEFVYNSIKQDLHFNSISGGTDINGCFACGSPISPVYAGQIQSAALGMKISAFNEQGKPVLDEQGELVCEQPSPSMPLYFWNDDGYSKYKKAYFDYYKSIGKNVWRHGDYIVIDSQTGGVTFHGRSDAVLKPSGVRIGTSEIYNIVELLPEIEDSVAIGQKWEGDQRIILFVKLRSEYELTDELKTKIRKNLKEKASPRHIPSLIIETKEIPYTFSNKKVEIAITNLAHGKKVTNRGALANPESLDFYKRFFENLAN